MHCAVRSLTNSRSFTLFQGSLSYMPYLSGGVVGPMHDVWVCYLQIAEEVKDYKGRNPSWHGPKSIKKRTG